MSLPRHINIFPNRPYWNSKGEFVDAPDREPICWCPPATSAESNLCSQCQSIQLRHLIFCEVEGQMISLGKLDTMIARPGCDLCSLLVLGCKQNWLGLGTWEDAILRDTGASCTIGALEMERQQAEGYALQMTVQHTEVPWQWLEFEIILDRDQHRPGKALLTAERSIETFLGVNFEVLKNLLQSCEENHNGHENSDTTIPREMFLIDLIDMKLIVSPENTGLRRYCALSYVWGKPSQDWVTLTKQNFQYLQEKDSLRRIKLPQTVKDAMQVCTNIGEKLLWVDSLCIIQDDPIDQQRQIDTMDSIYSAAFITLVAAAGDHANSGLPGVSAWLRDSTRQTIRIQDIQVSNTMPPLKDTLGRSIWNTRGWTYQERMFSRRCLFFSSCQSYYVCPTDGLPEIKGRLQESVETYEGLWSDNTKSLKYYAENVTNYSRRTLTSQDDILRACQGVMNQILRNSPRTTYHGLPEESFVKSLLWQPEGPTESRVASITLPSWSWISVMGPVKYTFQEDEIRLPIASTVPAYWSAGDEPSTFPIRWLLISEKLEQIVLQTSASSVSSGNVNQFPHEEPTDEMRELALQKPGRLLFSTQFSHFELRNNVPYTKLTSWWTDYTTDIDLSSLSILSILVPGDDVDNPAGFIEMDKRWAEQTLRSETQHRQWEFIAISLSTTAPDDYMHIYLTLLRNHNFPLVWRRNVRQLIVNVMLIEWNGGVARRLGVGRVFLDMWEKSNPGTKWIILE